MTVIVLLNVLISLFSSAYSEVRICFSNCDALSRPFFLQIIDNAEAQYLAFFAGKTIGMIRAPDSYVFPAPFNVVETFLVAPFE